MSLFTNIKNFLNQSNDSEQKAPKGLCPNCWGRQEYEGKFYEALKNNKVDIKQLDKSKGWIENYVSTNLTAIQLVDNKDGKLTCATCKLSFKEA